MNSVRKFILSAVMACLIFATAAAIQPTSAEAGPNPVVIMETSMGRIFIMLYPKDAPKTVANFLKYVNSGFYDNTIFHRVIQQRIPPEEQKNTSMNIVQGGGFTFPIKKKRPTQPPVPNEAATGLVNTAGTIAMARTNDPNSATTEFFFNVEDNPVLDFKQTHKAVGAGKYSGSTTMGYCAFGKVIRGMDVVRKIHQVKTARSGRMEDVPVKPIFIQKAYQPK